MDLQAEIERIIAQAAQQISSQFRAHVTNALSVADLARKSPGRRASRPSSGSRVVRRVARGKGAKRPKEQIEALQEKVAAFIAKNPGRRIEQINGELGTSTKDLALPLRKLIADRVVATKGEKRATTYFPGRRK